MAKPNKSWVQRVMATSDATSPPLGIFKASLERIADAADVRGVAPRGLTSWQRMVLFHRNRGGKGLSDERRKALEEAIHLLSARRQERQHNLNGYREDTFLPHKLTGAREFAALLGKQAGGMVGAVHNYGYGPTSGPNAIPAWAREWGSDTDSWANNGPTPAGVMQGRKDMLDAWRARIQPGTNINNPSMAHQLGPTMPSTSSPGFSPMGQRMLTAQLPTPAQGLPASTYTPSTTAKPSVSKK